MSNSRREDVDKILDNCLALIEQGLGLDECLDLYPEHRAELQRMLPVAIELRGGRSLKAPQALRGRIDARLVAIQAEGRRGLLPKFVTNLAGLRSIPRTWNPYPLRRASMIPTLVSFIIVAIVSFGGLVAGADAAGPGDLLYGLDTAIEDVRLSITRDDEREAELRIEFATERLEELKIEVEGEGDPEDIQTALSTFMESLAALESLLGELTPEQRAALEGAVALLNATSQEVAEFEFEFEVEDGGGELKLELDFDNDELDDDELEDDDLEEDDLGDDDLEDDDLDDDDLEDDDLEDDDLEDDDLEDDDLEDDDLDDDECESPDNSGEGSHDGEDNSGEGSHDDDCDVDDDDEEDEDDDDHEDDDDEDEEDED